MLTLHLLGDDRNRHLNTLVYYDANYINRTRARDDIIVIAAE